MRVVTIDGPAGSGKSTVAKRLAERLGWRLLDTGAMYRAVALAALDAGIDLSSPEEVGELAERVEVQLPPGKVLLDGRDVTAEIRTVRVTRVVRFAADSRRARRRLVVLQQAFASEYPVVTEGRDQGTIVFPNALCKVFLTATPEERARRRHAEFADKGERLSLEDLTREIAERDAVDAAREIAPMKPADDAVLVDTTGLTLEQVVDRLEGLVRERLDRGDRT
ncbi:MAG: (d)CMP kinase [Isosphaeraceae bacterium]